MTLPQDHRQVHLAAHPQAHLLLHHVSVAVRRRQRDGVHSRRQPLGHCLLASTASRISEAQA